MARPVFAELHTFSVPLLPGDDDDHGTSDTSTTVDDAVRETVLPPNTTRRLYLSHFLSTWNSRVFEFGAVLYLASIFPDTLLPVSVYALVRGISAVVLSPLIGRYVDTANRLQVVRLSILVQRVSVAASCSIFLLLTLQWHQNRLLTVLLLVSLAILACFEKLSSITNLVSVERDWVVVLAGDSKWQLRLLNSQMRRIDLFCKLGGPFVISVLDGISTKIAIMTNLGLAVLSVAVEYQAIATVYHKVPGLQQTRICTPTSDPRLSLRQSVRSAFENIGRELIWYFRHRAVRASLAGALLYFTVLSFAGQMTTYLLAAGYSSFHIGITRTVSVAFEISATWIAPWAMARVGPVRSGIWFINWQLFCLTVGASTFWIIRSPMMSASGLVVGTILSRIGLWGFDLSTQVIVQEEIDAEHRGLFSSIEASLQNLLELLSYSTTVYFSNPQQFRWPVLCSWIAVYVAALLYASFVRARRGHLVHLSKCLDHDGRKRRTTQHEYTSLSNSRSV